MTSNSNENFSNYHILIATGENTLENQLAYLNKSLDPAKRWTQAITPLKCGDILIGYKSETLDETLNNIMTENGVSCNIKPLIIIERKTISDFCSSHRSGRLMSQRARLITFRQQTGCQCHLVVEGYNLAVNEAIKKGRDKICNYTLEGLEQAWISTAVRDNFFLHHVDDETDHAKYIHKCLRTLEKYKLFDGDSHIPEKSYSESLKLKNKANLTPQMFYIKMIGAIPMFSINMSQILCETYPNLSVLIDELKTNDISNIAEIKIGKNKLGKVKAQRLKEYLLKGDPSTVPLNPYG